MMKQPLELAFPLHTQALREYFNSHMVLRIA